MLEKCQPRRYSNVNLHNYEPFEDIERCVHIQDVFDYNSNSLSPSKITRKDQSYLENKGIFVLWFGISTKPSQHHFYGNVGFIIRLQTLLDKFRNCRKLYYLETVERTDSVLSRLILTARPIEQLKPAVVLDLGHVGHPLYKDSCENYYHLKTIPGYKNGHNLEILIDMPRRRLDDAQWLFDNCRKIPVNHEEANSINFRTQNYRPVICYKYNNKQKECPHPYIEVETYNHMKREYPKFLDPMKKNSRVKPMVKNESSSTSISGTNENYSSYNITSPGRVSQPYSFTPIQIGQPPVQQNKISSTRASTSTTHENYSSYNITNSGSVAQPNVLGQQSVQAKGIKSARASTSTTHENHTPYNITNPGSVSQPNVFGDWSVRQKGITSARASTSTTHENHSPYNISSSIIVSQISDQHSRSEPHYDIESSRDLTYQRAQKKKYRRNIVIICISFLIILVISIILLSIFL